MRRLKRSVSGWNRRSRRARRCSISGGYSTIWAAGSAKINTFSSFWQHFPWSEAFLSVRARFRGTLDGMGIPRAPEGAGREGRRLWQSVLGEYELAGHELAVLRQAVRAADRCEALAAALAETGLVQRTAHGSAKLNPLAPELRAAELGLARLLVCLRIPLGGVEDEDQGQQRRGVRGVYSIGAA